jgi:hypothetical protein
MDLSIFHSGQNYSLLLRKFFTSYALDPDEGSKEPKPVENK